MGINSVDSFIEAVGGQEEGPTGASSAAPSSDESRVEWGPPTSMEGQDSLSRLGIQTGGGKSAAFHGAPLYAVTQQRHLVVKEAALGALAGKGIQAGAKLLGKYAPKLMKAAPKLLSKGNKAPGMLSRLGSKQVLAKGSRGSAVMKEGPGMLIDAGMEADTLHRQVNHRPSMFSNGKR
jgi:hypothetical protein